MKNPVPHTPARLPSVLRYRIGKTDSAILATASAYILASQLELSVNVPPLSRQVILGGRTAGRPSEMWGGGLRGRRRARGRRRRGSQIAAGAREWRIPRRTEPAVVRRPRPRQVIAPGRPQRPVMTLASHELVVRPDLGDPPVDEHDDRRARGNGVVPMRG